MSLVKIAREVSVVELEQMLRKVSLVSDKGQMPYKDARVELRNVWHGDANPIAFYLVQKNLEFQRALHDDLRHQGYNTLQMACGLEIINQQGERWLLTPPIVEIGHEEVAFRNRHGDIAYDGHSEVIKVPIIVDGLHRFWMARERGEEVSSLCISEVPENLPIGALPNSWEKIRIYTDVPKTKEEKKLYRTTDAYKFYRDFDSVGMGRRRLTGQGEVVQ